MSGIKRRFHSCAKFVMSKKTKKFSLLILALNLNVCVLNFNILTVIYKSLTSSGRLFSGLRQSSIFWIPTGSELVTYSLSY